MDCFEWVPPVVNEVSSNYCDGNRVTTKDDDETRLDRRRRADQASKLIGDYLLRGYTMLASVCPMCDSVLMKKGDGDPFCVACDKLGSIDTGNKAGNYNGNMGTNSSSSIEGGINRNAKAASTSIKESLASKRGNGDTTAENDQIVKNEEKGIDVLDRVMSLVNSKMAEEGDKLSLTDDVEVCAGHLRLIKACAECIVALKQAKNA